MNKNESGKLIAISRDFGRELILKKNYLVSEYNNNYKSTCEYKFFRNFQAHISKYLRSIIASIPISSIYLKFYLLFE